VGVGMGVGLGGDDSVMGVWKATLGGGSVSSGMILGSDAGTLGGAGWSVGSGVLTLGALWDESVQGLFGVADGEQLAKGVGVMLVRSSVRVCKASTRLGVRGANEELGVGFCKA
jgi:hypothetical protein